MPLSLIINQNSAPAKELPEDPPFTGRIGDVSLADRLSRATGVARFTYVMSRGLENKPKWHFRPGDTIRLRFEYEIVEPVASLLFGLRLYLPTSGYSGQQVVTDIRELISQEPLEAGVTGSIEVVVPDVHLMSNDFLIYAFLSNKEGEGGFDIIDEDAAFRLLSSRAKIPTRVWKALSPSTARYKRISPLEKSEIKTTTTPASRKWIALR